MYSINRIILTIGVSISTVEGLSRNGVHDKSTWGPPPSTLPLQHQPRCDSGDSESAVRPSLPNSRSSSINNMSAPSSSQSQHRSLYNKPNNNTSNLNKNPEYGHDFFSSGNWAESKPFIGTFDASLEESSKASTARTTNTTDIGIRGDTGNAREHSGGEGNTKQQLQFLPSHRKGKLGYFVLYLEYMLFLFIYAIYTMYMYLNYYTYHSPLYVLMLRLFL